MNTNGRSHDFYIILPEETASIKDHATRASSLVTDEKLIGAW